MFCNNCGNDKAVSLRVKIIKAQESYSCNLCGGVKPPWFPDVYFKEPYFEGFLADSKNPNGIYFNSRNEKARKMKELGIREAGDKIHGSRMGYKEKF